MDPYFYRTVRKVNFEPSVVTVQRVAVLEIKERWAQSYRDGLIRNI